VHAEFKKQSIGEVLLTFLALYVITQLFWMVIALQDVSRNMSYGPFKVAIQGPFRPHSVTNIAMHGDNSIVAGLGRVYFSAIGKLINVDACMHALKI